MSKITVFQRPDCQVSRLRAAFAQRQRVLRVFKRDVWASQRNSCDTPFAPCLDVTANVDVLDVRPDLNEQRKG